MLDATPTSEPRGDLVCTRCGQRSQRSPLSRTKSAIVLGLQKAGTDRRCRSAGAAPGNVTERRRSCPHLRFKLVARSAANCHRLCRTEDSGSSVETRFACDSSPRSGGCPLQTRTGYPGAISASSGTRETAEPTRREQTHRPSRKSLRSALRAGVVNARRPRACARSKRSGEH